ncbi:hypothetical protein E5F92_009180 [Flavobacterium columnare]|uniref:hypothetical protein n=1 Tax=Flavobacterium columnare TaxID=996 RepID=UPI002989D32A|nr:hypothetical protein [Flavobacterium columnare]MCH4832837.1 hypothetical protein [Flavobacterium columnare]
MSFTPLINGREYGWADIIVNISATPLSGIKHVKYEEEQEKENITGQVAILWRVVMDV